MQPHEELEQRFARWAGLENPVACCNGTAALHLALEALELPPGSFVICPEFTMIACARAIVLAGLRPLFVDCGDDLLMDPELVGRAVEGRWRGVGAGVWRSGQQISAVLVVHVYGRRCDMFRLRKATERFGIRMIEDMAEAHGVEPYTSDAVCYSFYQNKIVAGEEGGLVAFPYDPTLAELAKKLRCQGFDEFHNFLHVPRGCNYRLSNANARIIHRSLLNAAGNIAKRKQVIGWYDELVPREYQMPPREAPWVYDLRIPGMQEAKQNVLIKLLNKDGVAARHSFKPMSRQEEFAGPFQHLNAHRLSQEVIYLPVHPSLSREVVERNVQVFLAAL